jgi:multiple sugar transport system permease protein
MPAATSTSAKRWRISGWRLLAWLMLTLAIGVTIFPFWWVLRTALSSTSELYRDPTSLLPVGFTTDNFRRVLGLMTLEERAALGGTGTLDVMLNVRNSLIVTITTVLGSVSFSAMAAYAFARLRFPFRDKFFFLFLMALMFPGVITLIPNYILINDLGWINTFQGIIAPGFLLSPFAIFFLRQFFMGVNRELEEAAKLDGCSLFGIFWRIILPLSRVPLLTLIILNLITSWNDFFWPNLVGRGEEVRVLPVALGVFRDQIPGATPDWGGLMAGAVVTMVPTIILFLFLGRKLVDSIQFTGIK